MINHLYKISAMAVLFLGMSFASSLRADTITVKMADLPPAIKKAIREKAGRAQIDNIEKVTDDEKIIYQVEIGRAARARSFTLDEDGKLLDEEIFLTNAPPVIQAAIKKAAGAGSIDDITKIYDDGEISYEVDITRDNKERTLTLDDTGRLTEVQVFPGELPAPIQQTMQKALAGGQLGDITKEFNENGITYEVEINPDAKSRTITIDEKGAIVSDETDTILSETPDAVQKAIKDLLKDGKLGHIIKTTDEYGVNFDVDMKRNEKWDTIIISDDGKVVE